MLNQYAVHLKLATILVVYCRATVLQLKKKSKDDHPNLSQL